MSQKSRFKGPFDPLTSNMVNGPKHCWNLNQSNFTIFIDLCEGNQGWKSLSEWYTKSYGCLLTHWMPMTSIFFLKETIYCHFFRRNDLTNEKSFLNSFLNFLNLDSILNFFKNKDDPHSWCILLFTDSEIRR